MEYKAYSFDLDDNLLKLPTCVYLKDENGEIREFSTFDFEKIRLRLDELNLEITDDSFKGFLNDEQFIIDINNSTKAGSWRNLEKCIVKHTSLFAIITARGHSPSILKKGLKQAIMNNISRESLEIFVGKFLEKYDVSVDDESIEGVLDAYLDLCRFYPVKNNEMLERFGSDDVGELKFLAFEEFREYVKAHVRDNFGENVKVKIGFSDDSDSHLNKMVNNFLEKNGLFFYKTEGEGKTKY